MSDLREELAMQKFSEVNQEIEEALKQPKREWVGLTDEELKQLCELWEIVHGGWITKFAKDIEAKLKEKNT